MAGIFAEKLSSSSSFAYATENAGLKNLFKTSESQLVERRRQWNNFCELSPSSTFNAH
jgi:hypothetical protein